MVKTPPPAEIKRLWRLGFAVHWLRPKSKIPVDSGWTSGPRADWDSLKARFKAAYNYGVRLGSASEVAGGYLAILDVDVKSDEPRHRKEAYAALFKLFPLVRHGPHLLSGRGNGSAHFYVRVPEPTSGDETKAESDEKIKVLMPSVPPSKDELETLTKEEITAGWRTRPAWGVALYCDGRQAVLVGSVHPDTGKPYTWGKAVGATGKDIPLLDGGNVVRLRLKEKGDREHKRGPKSEPLELADVDLEKLPLTEEQRLAIAKGKGVSDRSAEVYRFCLTLAGAGLADETILSVFTDRQNYLGNCAFDHARTNDRQRAARWVQNYCLRKAKAKVASGSDVFDVDEIDVPSDSVMKAKKKAANDARPKKEPPPKVWPPGFTGTEAWEKDIEFKFVKKRPFLKLTLANIMTILTAKAECTDFVRFEHFTQKMHWCKSTPWGIPAGQERSTGFQDAILIKKWFADTFKVEPNNTMIDEALFLIAEAASHHVVRDYLESLDWDGTPRIDEAFRTYLGATMPEPYLSAVSRKFFLACVKRIFDPGCKFDYVVVLEGTQGIGKSTFAEILASKPWFMDGLPPVQDKDAATNLQGIWICELSELAAIYRTGSNEAVKGFIARTVDRVRPAYGHRRIDYPRSTVFIGTTNAHDYLTDPTGNRRYWPVLARQCDFAALLRDRDQLWAEAVHRLFFDPEPLFLDNEEVRRQAEQVQELRRVEDESDTMMQLLSTWLKEERKTKGKTFTTTMTDLFRGPLVFMPLNRSNMMRVGAVLRKLGATKVEGKKFNAWQFRKGGT